MILTIHDKRNWLQPADAKGWIDGAHSPGLTIYNDPVEITFRKNDSDIRKDLVITMDDDGDWEVRFFNDGQVYRTLKI